MLPSALNEEQPGNRHMAHQETFSLRTDGRGTVNITSQIDRIIERSGVTTGLCQVFVHHTSASLILCENADPTVRSDLETLMKRIAPDGDPAYRHTLEGDDDMAAHMRSILTNMNLSVPVTGGRAALGTWQGIYLWEHRYMGHQRRITVTVID